MRLLAIFILLGAITSLAAQVSSQFDNDQRVIEDLVAGHAWDSALVRATDLIVEEPLRPEGYYYMALSLFKKLDLEAAHGYNRKASLFGDESWRQRAADLDQRIEEAKRLFSRRVDVSDPQSLSGYEWKALWELDKEELDFAVHAIERFLEANNKVEALRILDDPMVKSIAGATDLVKKLGTSIDVVEAQQLSKLVEEGDALFAAQQFHKAVERYGKANSLNPDDRNISGKLHQAEEERDWRIASAAGTIESYEKYLEINSYHSYRNRAFAIIVDLIKPRIQQLANLDRISEAEDYYRIFVQRYALSKKDKQSIDAILCDMYFRNILDKRGSKRTEDRKAMLDLYHKARRFCELTDAQKKEIAKLEKLVAKGR